MKRYILCFFLLMCFLLSGCGEEHLDDVNRTVLTEVEGSDTHNNISVEIINPIELSDFIVTNGDSIIKLDYPYNKFEIDLPEITLENNYVGEIYVGDIVYKTYMHKYDDFTLYTSNLNYNLKDRKFDDYYITQITLKTPEFKTMRGVRIGSSIEEIKNSYGDLIQKISNDKSKVIYDFEDKELVFIIGVSNKVEEIILRVVENDIS